MLATYSTRKVVQTSWTSKPFPPRSNRAVLIPGWVAGMKGMKVGGRRELILPPVDGYQDTSPGAGIAKNDTLHFHHRPHKVEQMSDHIPNPDGSSEKRQKFNAAPPMIIDT